MLDENDEHPIWPEGILEGAQEALLALMKGISQEVYDAGWKDGLERLLWKEVSATSPRADLLTSTRQRDLLRLLSDEAYGWWIWRDDQPRFVSRTEWENILRLTTPEQQKVAS